MRRKDALEDKDLWLRFGEACKRGRIGTTSTRFRWSWNPVRLAGLFVCWAIQTIQGFWNHIGVIGYDEFFFNMRAGGLRYSWLGRYVEDGSTVGIWVVKQPWRFQLTSADYQRAFEGVKAAFRRKTEYGWLALFTAGRVRLQGRKVCSELVKEYLRLLLLRFPEVDPQSDPFLTPNEIGRYCELVAVFNDRPGREPSLKPLETERTAGEAVAHEAAERWNGALRAER